MGKLSTAFTQENTYRNIYLYICSSFGQNTLTKKKNKAFQHQNITRFEQFFHYFWTSLRAHKYKHTLRNMYIDRCYNTFMASRLH